ncbi:unnamed protein product [Closterium sp. NIES-65]|nr:unnamed protein product [Closterium sp. NIES-65]
MERGGEGGVSECAALPLISCCRPWWGGGGPGPAGEADPLVAADSGARLGGGEGWRGVEKGACLSVRLYPSSPAAAHGGGEGGRALQERRTPLWPLIREQGWGAERDGEGWRRGRVGGRRGMERGGEGGVSECAALPLISCCRPWWGGGGPGPAGEADPLVAADSGARLGGGEGWRGVEKGACLSVRLCPSSPAAARGAGEGGPAGEADPLVAADSGASLLEEKGEGKGGGERGGE